jgi:hypothetical protein
VARGRSGFPSRLPARKIAQSLLNRIGEMDTGKQSMFQLISRTQFIDGKAAFTDWKQLAISILRYFNFFFEKKLD